MEPPTVGAKWGPRDQDTEAQVSYISHTHKEYVRYKHGRAHAMLNYHKPQTRGQGTGEAARKEQKQEQGQGKAASKARRGKRKKKERNEKGRTEKGGERRPHQTVHPWKGKGAKERHRSRKRKSLGRSLYLRWNLQLQFGGCTDSENVHRMGGGAANGGPG